MGHYGDSNRAIVAIDYTENANIILALNQHFVKTGSDIMYDENHLIRVWISITLAGVLIIIKNKGINNLAESFNAHFRDLHRGVHHKCDNKYALHYANQVAFMSNNCQNSNGELFNDILKIVYGFCH